jgi:hypothetical protein
MYSFIRVCLLTVLAVAGVSTAAHASAHYRVWYFDDNFNTYNEGDVTDGWTKLVPPAWACGILFYDPSYYRWVNSDGNNIGDGNFNKDVRVWTGKPGCSESLGIEYSDNSQSFPHQVGGSYMEITTNYGFSWIDDEGGWPSCGACVGPDELTYFPDRVDWAHIVASEFLTVKPSLLDSRLRSRSVKAIGQLGQHVAELFPALQAQVMKRRATYLLGDLETPVRALENAALSNLYYSLRMVSTCMSQAQLGRFSDAYAACTVGGELLDATDSLVNSAQSSFQKPPR